MVVYVLTSNYVCVDSGDYINRVEGVYESVLEAQEHMQREIEDARTDFQNYDTEEDDYVEGDMSWSIWEKDEYMAHHYAIEITVCQIK